MKLCNGIHQIRIDFQVTPQVKRYVYVYLIESKYCYLIDTGVAGSETILAEYMKSIGRDLSEIKGIFLTHAHPDHIGGAARLKELTGCRIYASSGEQRWIEDIDLQYQERPIPNFYQLTGNSSVQVDRVLHDGDIIQLEEQLHLEAISTSGHSQDDFSFFLQEKEAVFTGDAIPVPEDIPIYINSDKSIESLKRLAELSVPLFCPAWDQAYVGQAGRQVIERAVEFIQMLEQNMADLQQEYPGASEYTHLLCEKIGRPELKQHPLFQRTVRSHMHTQKAV
ncbi:MBL fold metallo-hydrolase [Butyricicoccus sp.]|uniref:MBL fold metallo-hydrolase n=1 Tax=Butyricicoccus sp. TaxID=2049021 RepID=UPI003F189D14